jgi:hypothetical protein
LYLVVEIRLALVFAVGSDQFFVFFDEIRPVLVFCSEIRSTLDVLRRDLTSVGVLRWFSTGYWCFSARSDRLSQFFGEFSIGVEVFGKFSFGVGFLWNFSLFIFGLVHFLVQVFFISLSLYCVLQAIRA